MQSQHMQTHAVPREQESERERSLKFVAAGSTGEAIAGAGAVTLAILGLAGVLPFYMMTIATICAGGALFLEGSSLVAAYRDLEIEINRSTKTHVALGGGMAFELIGGIGGIALGILALVGIMPMTLVAVAAIGMGGALLLGSGATERLDKIRTHFYAQQEPVVHWVHESVMGATGLQVLAGLAAVALGILALLGFVSAMLAMISMLTIGGSVLLTGAALTGKMATAVHH